MQAEAAQLPAVFYAAIEQELDAHPEGLREYDLIVTLRARGLLDFLPPPPAPPEQLFRAHFLLYHALYRLADRLAAARQGRLQIEALCIRRLPWSAAGSELAAPDPLRAYYLDWSNLEKTGADEVSELLAAFWNRLGRFDGRAAALAELGLEDPVDDHTIKQAWRRLAMTHHPDRGGDNERLQAINAAVDCLIR